MTNDKQQKNSSAFLGSVIRLDNYAANLIRQLAPFFEASKTLNEALRPMHEMQEQMFDIARSLTNAHRQMIAQNLFVANDFSRLFQDMLKPLEDIRIDLNNLISPVFLEFKKNLDQLPDITRKSLMILAQHGWYFDLEMSFGEIWEIESVLENGDVETANQFLIEHFSSRLSAIEQRLKSRFPSRAKIFESAFNAHERKEYTLSVPIFLIQADGICYDLINKQLYSKRNKVPVITEYAKTVASDAFQGALLYPLTQPLPISASSNERAEDFNELNRHQVVHGESANYDTEINSLKAISLLNYVSYVLSQDSEDDFVETKS